MGSPRRVSLGTGMLLGAAVLAALGFTAPTPVVIAGALVFSLAVTIGVHFSFEGAARAQALPYTVFGALGIIATAAFIFFSLHDGDDQACEAAARCCRKH